MMNTEPGEVFETFYDAEEDEVILRRVKKKEDWVKVWLGCPVKTDQPLPKPSRYFLFVERSFGSPGSSRSKRSLQRS